MTSDRDERIKDLLAQLLDTPATQRAGVLELACGGDTDLRSEVESLARAYEEGSDFFAPPRTVELADSLAVGSRIGRYHLLKQLGEGGFGTVFLAEQQHPVRRRVALKLIKLGMDTRRVIARFNAERQALAMMDHPHIAHVYDAGASDTGRPYFVMELVEGVPITRFCDQNKLTIPQRLGLFMQVCQAVQHAHTKGIIHRDLKPTNILVSQQDGVPVPKVIDFGIAKATQGRLTEQSFSTDQQHWLGTPQYMSPEQADGSADIDTRTDIYSLGVILYELLCGAAPFNFKSSGYPEIQRIIREVDPPRLSSRTKQHELRGDLDPIVLKAMEKDRARRYETASGFAADIQRHLNNEPVTAHRAGRAYRLRKLVRRNKFAVGAAAAIMLTLAAGLVTSTAFYVKARDAKLAQSLLRDDAEARAYASDMLGIQQALAVNNLGRARMLLDRNRPNPGQKDRRGWEWRYLWQQCRSDAVAALRPKGAVAHVQSLAVSPDGRWVAADGGDGLSIWDMKARKELPRPPASRDWVHSAFSPRQPLLAYTSVAFDARGQKSFHVSLWDLDRNLVVSTADAGPDPQGLAFSADGKVLLVCNGGSHGGLSRRQVPELIETSIRLPVSMTGTYCGVDFAPMADFSAVALIFSDQEVGALDLKTGHQWRESVIGPVTAVALSPDGRILAFSSGTAPAAIHLRNAATGEHLGPPVEGHLAWVGQMVFWPDGRKLASASADQTIRLWDVRDPAHVKPIGRPLRGHLAEIWELALLPDNKTLVSGAKDGTVYMWDSSRVQEDLSHPVLKPLDWAFGSAGASLTVVETDGRVERLEGRGFFERHTVATVGPKVAGAAFRDGDRILGCSFADATNHAWDVNSMKERRAHPRVARGEGDFWAVTPERMDLLYFASNNEAVEWDPVSGRELASWHPIGGIRSYATSLDGRWRVILGPDGVGSIAEAGGTKMPFDLRTPWTDSACFSPDSHWLAAVVQSGSGFAGLWRRTDLLAGGGPPAVKLGGFLLAPHSIAFSPDGRRVAVGGAGGEAVKLYDVDSGHEVLNLAGSGSLFGQTQFSADGNVLASSNAENKLHIWRAPMMAEIEAAEK